MELRDYVRAIRDRAALVLGLAVLGVVAGVVVTNMSPKIYAAHAQSFVSVTHKAGNAIYPDQQYVLGRMPSYAQLANTDIVLKPVLTQLTLPMTRAQLASHVSVTNPLGTVVLNVDVTDESAREAANIANAVADSLTAAISDLENARATNADQKVTVQVTKRAAESDSPISPRGSLNVALGLIVGLVLGLVVAILRYQSRRRVQSPEDLAEICGVSPSGTIPRVRGISRHPAIALGAGQAAEAFRMTWANMALRTGEQRPRSIAVISPSVGDGRTLLSINLAIAAARSGLRVCLVDTDHRRPKIARYLGLAPTVAQNVGAWGAPRVREAPWHGGLLHVAIVGQDDTAPNALPRQQDVQAFLESLTPRFDLVIVDTSPLLVAAESLVIASSCDATVAVARAGRTKAAALRSAYSSLVAVNASVMGPVLTAASRRAFEAGVHSGWQSRFQDFWTRVKRESPNRFSGPRTGDGKRIVTESGADHDENRSGANTGSRSPLERHAETVDARGSHPDSANEVVEHESERAGDKA